MTVLAKMGLPSAHTFLRPSKFVTDQPSIQAGTILEKHIAFAKISTIFLINTLLFTLPIAGGAALSLATIPHPLGVIASQFIFLSGVTFWAFHAGLILTRNSDGLLHSFQSVVYSTGIYLAFVLGYLYWSLNIQMSQFDAASIEPSTAGTIFQSWVENFAYWVYLGSESYMEGIYIIGGEIEIVGSIYYPGTDWNMVPESYSPVLPDALLADAGIAVYIELMVGILLIGYYLYSFYLSARVRHGATRFDGVIVTGVTLLAPIVSIYMGLIQTGSPTLIWVIGGLIVYFGYNMMFTPPTHSIQQ